MAAKAEAPTVTYESENIILSGNTLKAHYMPYFPLQIYTLGDFGAVDDTSIVWDVITCESGWNQNKVGKAGEIGMGQYLESTWDYFNELRGTELDINKGEDQLNMTLWAFKNGLECNWSCYKLLFPNECQKNSATGVANPIKVVEE